MRLFFVYLGKYGEMGLDLKWVCSGLGVLVVGWSGGLRKKANGCIFLVLG